MSLAARYPDLGFAAIGWQPDAIALMDEHHLVAWSLDAARRARFAAGMQQFLCGQRDTDVVTIHGRFAADLDQFCHQVELQVPVESLARRIHGARGLTEALRSRETHAGLSVARMRYLLWNDADLLLRANPGLFAELADALMGVAAETEYASEDLLLIQRVVFIGGPELDRCAAGASGPLSSWLRDGGREPFWRVVTGLDAPPVQRACIDDVMR